MLLCGLVYTNAQIGPLSPLVYRTDESQQFSEFPQAESVSLTLTAVAQFYNSGASPSVSLFYRPLGGVFDKIPMINQDSLWSANLPGEAMVPPAVEYYIYADDGLSSASDPGENPQTKPYIIQICPGDGQNKPPIIVRTPQTEYKSQVPQPQGFTISLSAYVMDSAPPFARSASLYYRQWGETNYRRVAMGHISGIIWSGTIPGVDAQAPRLEYYLEASDGDLVGTAPLLNPEGNPFIIQICDTCSDPCDPPPPPLIQRTSATSALSNTTQPENVDIDITALTADNCFPFVKSARLFYRMANAVDTSYTTIHMRLVSGNLWSGIIPAHDVKNPGIYYYLFATDGEQTGRSPNILNPDQFPYFIPVGTSAATVILRTEATIRLSKEAQLEQKKLAIDVLIYDYSQPTTQTATVYYRRTGSMNEKYAQMSRDLSENRLWHAEILAADVQTPGVDYYVCAEDGTEKVCAPNSGFFHIDVRANPPPVIVHNPVQYATEGQNITISARVFDTTNFVDAVQLHYKNGANSTFISHPMRNNGGEIYAGTIAGSEVKPDSVFYYLYAVDNLGAATKTSHYSFSVDSAQVATVAPNPFTPNNDGFNDYVQFDIPALLQQSGAVHIFNLRGKRIVKITNENKWYGFDENNQLVPPGLYLYMVKINDNVTLSGTLTVIR